MVRRATLQVNGYVFVLPEHVDGVTEYPFYAKVTALSTNTATIQSLELDDPVTCDIDIVTARTSAVSKAEATRTRQRQLVRQAAWTESAARFWHGQVVGMDGRLARLQLDDRVVLVDPSRLTPVAPVVALLLLRVPLSTSMTRDEVTAMQTTILARILDSSAAVRASNAIPTIPDGLVRPSDIPDGQSYRQWIDPHTGDACKFHLQHAVDYAFVVDGNQSAPAAVRMSVGPSFCRAPYQSVQVPGTNAPIRDPSPSSSSVSMERANSIISLFAQEDPCTPTPVASSQYPGAQNTPPAPAALEPDSGSAAACHPSGVSPSGAALEGFCSSRPLNQSSSLEARIMEQLLSQPELLARFVQVISTTRPTRPTTATLETEPARRTSKYTFTPTVVQVAVHEAITAPEHRGKAPSIYVETVVYAVAVRFQPHPGIIIRLYDFQFGMFGLSILHFVPFGVHQRMTWLNGGGVNMQNFSAGVIAPRPAAASTMGDLVDAARMLCRYGQEFFAQPVRDVLEALLDFVQQLDGWHSWIASDLPHLVFWINSVLEKYRSLVHSSDGNIHASSLQTTARFSLNDGELQNIMHALSRRSTHANDRSVLHEHRLPSSTTSRGRTNQQQARIPPAIFDLIPTLNGLPVCLRYLSALGCPSGASNRFVYGARAHAAPDNLDARVKGHIIQRMGGLSERFSHL